MNMAIKRSRIELSHHRYLIYATIEAVAHREINKPITSSNRNLSNTTRTKILDHSLAEDANELPTSH